MSGSQRALCCRVDGRTEPSPTQTQTTPLTGPAAGNGIKEKQKGWKPRAKVSPSCITLGVLRRHFLWNDAILLRNLSTDELRGEGKVN